MLSIVQSSDYDHGRPRQNFIINTWLKKNNDLKKKKKSIFYLNQIFFLIWYIDIYIDVYIYTLFQTCSIQIDLGTCFNRGYMIFAYIKTLDNVHKASPPVVA